MKQINMSLLTPLFKTIDRLIFGIEEPQEKEEHPEIKEWLIEKKPDDQDDKVAVRSIN